ncbi:MAG: hypothetical protein IPM74_03745 [Crocinitomicaceae bacterium]|nr:hypothetical protein [Crocinitomicaceae bacterium]
MPIEEIRKIRPLWHQRIADIDLSSQPDSLTDKYINNGFHIYKSSLTDLHKALDDGYEKLYNNDKLFSNQQDPDKLQKVLEYWENGVYLIPPMLIDNGYNHLVPADGKHRMKVSSIIDKDEVYFILFDVDLPKINKYFNPTLID